MKIIKYATLCAALACVGVAFGDGKQQKAKDFTEKNGIHVGDIKQFDDRMLLDRFNRFASSIAATGVFFDQSKIATAIGVVQGASASLASSQLGLNIQLPTTSFNNTSTVTGNSGTTGATTQTGTTSNGASSNGSTSGTTTTGTPTAGTTTTTTTTTTSTGANTSGTSTSTGTTSATTDQTSSTHTTSQAAPTAPGNLSTSPVDTGLKPLAATGIGSLDTLGEQTMLTYELLNLSFLLDRSITDRVYWDKSQVTGSAPRLNTVLGLSVSVQSKYRDAIADVIVDIKPDEPGAKTADNGKSDSELVDITRPSIVAMIPQQRTYNVASFANRTSGFSLSTVFQFVGLGAANQNTNATQYIARDSDTVALEHDPDPDAKDDLCFGWQFRPVLNKVTAETTDRQVFAAVSLPAADLSTDRKPTFHGTVSVRTRWLYYNRRTGVVGGIIPGSDSPVSSQRLDVYSSANREDALSPILRDINLTDAGSGNFLVSVAGDNFFPGTAVSLGTGAGADATYAVSSQRRLRFVAAASRLVLHDPEIVGPYGVGAYVRRPNLPWRLNVDETKSEVTPVDDVNSHVKIVLSKEKVKVKASDPDLPPEQKPIHAYLGEGPKILLDNPPSIGQSTTEQELSQANLDSRLAPYFVVAIGDKVYGPSNAPVIASQYRPTPTTVDPNLLQIDFDVPTATLTEYKRFTIRPLLGNEDKGDVYTPRNLSAFTISGVKYLQYSDDGAIIAFQGTNLVSDAGIPVSIRVNDKTFTPAKDPLHPGDTEFQSEEPNVIVIKLKRDDANKALFALIDRKGASPVLVSLDDAKPKGQKPANVSMANVTLNKEVDEPVTGDNLDAIKSASWNKVDLGWSVDTDKDGKKVYSIKLRGDVVKTGGQKMIDFLLYDGSTKSVPLQVSAS